MRRVYRGEALIEAPPEAVWATLVDLDGYGGWNPFTIAAESTLTVGEPVVLRVRFRGLPGVLRQVETVRRVEAPRALDWGVLYGGGVLMRAERTQRLEPVEGGTRYVTEDAMDGPLVPVVAAIFGRALARSFQAMADALKAEVERRAG